MFYISENNNNLQIHSVSNALDTTAKLVILEKPKQVAVIGKNSIFDNAFQFYTHKQSLVFHGKKYFDVPDKVQLDIYALSNNDGFLAHNKLDNNVFISRSFSLLVDYCLASGFSILGIIRQTTDGTKIPSITINNDFSPKHISEADTDPDNELFYDLDWTSNPDYINFNLIIKQQGYEANTSGIFFNEYKGYALNIGKFRQVTLKTNDDDQRVPEFFPEAELNNCVVFSELENDNAADILIPNVISAHDFNHITNQMKIQKRKTLCFSGLHKNGYGVQAFIELLDDTEATHNYKAKITKLIISPEPNLLKTFLF